MRLWLNIIIIPLTLQFISLVMLPPVGEPLGLVNVLVGFIEIWLILIPSALAATCATYNGDIKKNNKKLIPKHRSTACIAASDLGVDPLPYLHPSVYNGHRSITSVHTDQDRCGIASPHDAVPHGNQTEASLTPSVRL